MVGSSKILTVSYGTFSCTLEGFDDSFSTMKAIAEYFRDLASDDRYFGAEPPTPDAEMLARIAEREISRRVDARTEKNGIILRAASALEAPATKTDTTAAAEADPVAQPQAAEAPAMPPAATPPDQVKAAQEEVDLADETTEGQSQMDATAPSDDIQSVATEADEEDHGDALTFDDMAPQMADVPAHPDAESVAAKLQRIRAVVGKNAAAKTPDAMEEDQHSPSESATQPQAQDSFEADVEITDEHDLAPETAEAEADQVVAEAESNVTDDLVVDETVEDEVPADTATDETESVFEDDAEAAEAGISEILEDDIVADEAVSEVEETAVEADDNTDDVLSNVAAGITARTDKPIVRARIVRLRKESLSVEQVTETIYAEEPLRKPADESLITSVLGADETADVFEDQPEDFVSDVEMAEDDAEDIIETASDDVSGIEETVDVVEDNAVSSDDDEVSSDAETGSDEVDSIAALDGADELMGSDPQVDHTVSDLSAEDEAELQDELAEVEREVAEMPAAPQRHGRDILPKTDDAAMSRIMSQTDEALSEPEGSRRRNAIAQLKAAVAATEAARQLGDRGVEKAKTETAFREDLDQVVRPQRPVRPTRPQVSEETRTERPRPAPLKLVASQRVDAPAASQPEAPVQPRRVAIAAEAVIQSDATSFAEFAEEMGATELPDLLEAAAAYTAFVEGVEDFSRPQIMKKVQMTTDQAFSREDGLRSFGTLLRQGRISKVRNGRFQVSEQTRFRPEQRAG